MAGPFGKLDFEGKTCRQLLACTGRMKTLAVAAKLVVTLLRDGPNLTFDRLARSNRNGLTVEMVDLAAFGDERDVAEIGNHVVV